MNTKKEQNTSKEEIKAERRELTDAELEQVSGGAYLKDTYDEGTNDLCYPGKYDEYSTQSH